jgi:DNA-binding NtrC family response regulator
MDTATYSDAVTAFKRELLTRELHAHAGNRTATSRALGLQRTYLLRLIRDFGVDVPPPRRRPTSMCRDHAVSSVVTERLDSSR